MFFIILVSFLLTIAQSARFESVDEKMIANWIWEFHEDPFRVNQYPPLFIYLHFFLSLCYQAFFLLTGMVKSGYEFLHTGLGYNFMIEAGRYVSAFFGMVMLYSVYKTGERSQGFIAASASLLLLAFNDIFILHSHIFKSDIMVSALISLSIYYLFRFLDGPGGKWMFLASLFFGLSFSAKYNIAVFLVVILMAAMMENKKFPAIKSMAVAAAGGVTGFLITAPNWIVNPVGNLKKLLHAYNLEKGSVYIQDLSPSSIYIRFLADIRDQLGILLALVLVFAMILSFVRKDKKGVLLSVFLVVYILFFGLTGFYGRRFLLPLLPAIVFLIAGALFRDLPALMKLNRKMKSAWTSVVVSLLAVFVFLNGVESVKKFRILGLESKSDTAIRFRQVHNMNESRYAFGSHIMTPYIKGDVRLKKTLEIKPFFIKQGVPHFLQIREEAYRHFVGLPAPEGKYFIRLPEFRIFHRIERPKIQDWDYNLLFLYRIPDQLKNLVPGDSDIELPKMFGKNNGDLFVPEQVYEKLSGYFVSENDLCATTLYSGGEISAVRGVIYSTGSLPGMTVRVNNREIRLAPVKGRDSAAPFSITGFKRKSPFYGNAYRVEVHPSAKRRLRNPVPFHVVLEPVTPEDSRPQNKAVSFSELNGVIPVFHSGGVYPEWVRKIYLETGVDLALYKLTQTLHFDFSQSPVLNKPVEILFPSHSGEYMIELDARPLSRQFPVTRRYEIEYEVINPQGKTGGRIRIADTGEKTARFSVKKFGSVSFVKFRFLRFPESNLVLNGVVIYPDIKSRLMEK